MSDAFQAAGASAPRVPERKSERTRRRILESAEQVFGARGYHDASIAEITQKAGVAPGTFYLYFPSKHEIFSELIRTRAREHLRVTREAVRGRTGRLEEDTAGVRAFMEWLERNRHVFRVVRQAEYVEPGLLSEWYSVFADQYARVLGEAMDAGEIPRTDPELLAWAVMGMVDLVAMRWIVWDDAAALSEAQLHALLEIVVRAIAGHPASAATGYDPDITDMPGP